MPCLMGAAAQEGCISPALSNVMGTCWGQTSLEGRLSDWVDSVADVVSPSGPNPQQTQGWSCALRGRWWHSFGDSCHHGIHLLPHSQCCLETAAPCEQLVKTCTEQQRHRGWRNSETFLESSEALQVWIYWEDSKKTATCPCTTSYHTLVMTQFPSCQVMARSCVVPLAGAVSVCVDPSHKAARKTCVICFGVRNLSASWTRRKFDICLALHLYMWGLLMPVSPNVWVTRQGVWIYSVQKYFCSLFCELFVYEVGGKLWNSQWWGDSATGFPVLSAGFFRLARWGVGVSFCVNWLHFAHSQRKRAEWRLLAVITIIKFRKGHALWNVFLKALVTGR